MGVPTHRIEIRKEWNGQSWSNDYLVEASSMDTAAAFAIDTVEFERELHFNMIQFIYVRTSTVTKFDRIFRHIDLNLPGLSSTDTTNTLPLFNTVRMDLRTADSDPCRKYFRVPIPESQQDNGVLAPAWIASRTAILDAWIAGFDPDYHVVSKAGHNVIGGSVYPFVQMRQLHRHKRPKAVL